MEEAFRRSCAGADESRSDPVRLRRSQVSASSRRWSSGRRGRCRSGRPTGGTPGRRALTGHAGNQNAAKLTRDQKQELKKILAQPPSRSGVHAGFWDVPAIREVVKILFDVEYQSDSSYQLLLRLCGLSLEPSGPVRRAPRRESHHQTHDRSENPSQSSAGRRLGGLHGRRGPLGARGRDPPHAAPERTAHQAVRGPEEDVPVLLRRPLPDRRNTLSRGTRTPSRRSSRWNDSNAKPRQRRSRPSWTTPDPTTRKR